eukprot:3721192-Pyramimonas_sp.AAC.1
MHNTTLSFNALWKTVGQSLGTEHIRAGEDSLTQSVFASQGGASASQMGEDGVTFACQLVAVLLALHVSSWPHV